MATGVYMGFSESIADVEWVTITASNLSTYFTVTNDSYYFVPSGSTFTSNNNGVGNSTAKTSLKPLQRLYGFSFDYSVSSESGYDTFSCTYGSSTSPTTALAEISGTVSSSYSTDASVSTSRYINFMYTKDSSVNSGNDKVVISNFKIGFRTGTYTQKDLARKVVDMYIGVDGLARRIKKAFIGVNGIARLFYCIPEVERATYVNLTTNQGDGSNCYFGGAANSNYAIFTDGCYGGTPYLYAINTSGTVVTKSYSSINVQLGCGGCHFPSYALFMGADGGSANGIKINTSNTISTTKFGSGTAREYMYSQGTGCNAGPLGTKYAIYTGDSSYLDYMNSSGTWSYTTLSFYTFDAGVADNGTLAIIAGGWGSGGSPQSTVNTFNTSGTRGTATSLSTAVSQMCGARAGNLAILAGGSTSSSNVYSSTAYSYNTSGTRTVLANMSVGRSWHSAASGNGKFAIFMGHVNGSYDSSTWYGDFYNSSGTKVDFGKIGYCVDLCSHAYVGNKVYYTDDNNIKYDDFYVGALVVNDLS